MQIETSRFGAIEVSEDQVLTFARGLLGLSDATRYVLLPAGAQEGGGGGGGGGDNARFYWMQSLEDPNLAFLVTDPGPFFKDYVVPIREETQQDLQLADTKDGRLLVICNRAGEWLTGNLLGPLVVNTVARVGLQVVLTEKKWTCRQPMLKLDGAERKPAPAEQSGQRLPAEQATARAAAA